MLSLRSAGRDIYYWVGFSHVVHLAARSVLMSAACICGAVRASFFMPGVCVCRNVVTFSFGRGCSVLVGCGMVVCVEGKVAGVRGSCERIKWYFWEFDSA